MLVSHLRELNHLSDGPKGGRDEELKRREEGTEMSTKGVESDTTSAVSAAVMPSKEFLAEGFEQTYRTNTCPMCRRCFKMRSHLQEHLHLHFPDPNLQCPTCKRFFTSKSKLRVHMLREAGTKLHHCHLCSYSAVERNAVHRHLTTVHTDQSGEVVGAPRYQCPSCSQSFHLSRALKAHIKTHHIQSDKALRACFHTGCSFQSSQSKELIRHIAEKHRVKAVKCRQHSCDAVFQSKADMESHCRTHLAYHCSQCDFSCSKKSVFLQHQRQGHPGKDKLCCDFCFFVTFNPVEFQQHIGHLHAKEKIHHCPQCTYVTSHKRGLKRHMLMHSGEKPHKCTICEFRCRDESYLSKHVLTHSNDKNFMCAECGYVTKWKHYLNVHMRKHAGDLRYSCDQCSYRCHRMDQLKSHKLRHQPKSLMCEICAYACKRQHELRNHVLAKHSGEKRQPTVHKCKYCPYTTHYRQALQNHENCKHTRLKEFRCALCFYSSFSSISLFIHKRKTHGYKPGDKAWLENYAAKEKERNSSVLVQDFYIKPVAHQEHVEHPIVKPSAELDSHNSSKDTIGDSHPVSSVDIVHVVSQELISKGTSEKPTFDSSSEEYCTLVLTTLSATDLQRPASQEEEKTSASSSTFNYSNESQKKTDFSLTMISSGEDNEMSDPEGERDEPENNTSKPVEPVVCNTKTSELEINNKTSEVTSALHCSSFSDIHLKAVHENDLADAMVLQEHVQMHAVPIQGLHHCEKCPYVTCDKTALEHHHQASCESRMKEDQSHACGTLFTQRSKLEGHLKNQCSASNKETLSNFPLCKKCLYAEKDGKYECRLCSFSSVRLPSVKRHLATCGKILRRKENHTFSSESHEGESRDESSASDRVSEVLTKKGQHFKQNQALDSHKREGCLKMGEIQCHMCSFVAKSKPSLSLHYSYAHGKKKMITAKRSPCQHGTFSCEEERCVAPDHKYKGIYHHHCGYCSFSSARRHCLGEHKSMHTGTGRHSCDQCHKTFAAVAKLRQHKTRIHNKHPTHVCQLCDFSSHAFDDVRRHNLRCHTGVLEHCCTRCDAQFSSEIALKTHCKRAHLLEACFLCKHCDYKCYSSVTLQAHTLSKHPVMKCKTCQESFETKESLNSHQKTHLAHQCQMCPFGARTKQLLAQHLLNQHEDGSPVEKPLKCSTCQFACRHQLVLEQHLRTHGSKRLYKCTDCKYSTHNKQKITWHIRIHTGEKPYNCEQCSYSCTDPSRLKLHMRVHQEERKYICPDCGYKCKWATQLKYHMTKHTGEKRYVCNECDYRTNRADALRTHRDTQHCDERPFICEKCGKAFKTSFILKTHQRQHSDGHPYTCGLCQKSFRWPAGLRHHFLSHTKQQPFSCRHCSYTAKQRFQVVRHLHRHHPEESAEQGVVRDSEAGTLTLKEALLGTLDEKSAVAIARGEDDAAGTAEQSTEDTHLDMT
ncbi:zinc finger protein 142 isoform X1 [Gouania willdenowi]|uniref:zinc finger protein 142 isoform X1 n=1 Tax=Gouania willdenowi TaxID=441366 RepID=UPI0010545725|nr:zinc finger protein 142 isoform X1 [Gouania willdenowi]